MTTTHPSRAEELLVGPGRPSYSRAWALAGLGAAVAGIVGIVGSSLSGAVYEDDIAGDAPAIADRLGEMTGPLLVFHLGTMVAVLLLVVFAAGLRRRLAGRLPADSLLPGIAHTGLVLVSVAGLLGSGLTTEFLFGAGDPDLMVPETAAFFGHWVGTIPWLWAGAGLAALSVAAAALRHGAAARWLGVTSLVLGGLTTLFAISPLQYMAGMVAPLWLLVASIGFLTEKHR